VLDKDQKLTKEIISQYELPEDYWENFKSDIGHKSLIGRVDKGIATRQSFIRAPNDPEEDKRIQQHKATYFKLKFLDYIAIALYIVLCVFERPSWCINPRYMNSS